MHILLWLGFLLFLFIVLALDLGVFSRKTEVISPFEALALTVFWIVLALLFNVAVYFMYEYHWLGIGLEIGHELSGKQAALQFFTGYLLEKTLSFDNIFVIALIFTYFRIALKFQHRVLFWGIFGAVVLRGIMIIGGLALFKRFDWIAYLFGVLLFLTAVRMLIARHDNLEPDKNIVVKFFRWFYPVQAQYVGKNFFTRMNGHRAITPLFLALLMIESSDVVFAIDSIPAIFAITTDPFIVFTSNMFAILGLRSLYFALAIAMEKMRYIKMSLVFLLAFIGVKMILYHHVRIPTYASLSIIVGILAVGLLASFLGARKDTAPLLSPIADEIERLIIVTYKNARRVIIVILGTSVLLIGTAMIVLPGPAILIIPAGLAILATEFIWARILLRKIKNKTQELTNAAHRTILGKKED